MLNGGRSRGAASEPPISGLSKTGPQEHRGATYESQPPAVRTVCHTHASSEKGKWLGYHEWQTTCKATNHPRNELGWEFRTATVSDVQTCAAKIPRRMRTAKSRMNCHKE